MNLFKHYDWFIVYKLPKIEEEKTKNLLKKDLIDKFKSFFFWKLKKINYYEPHTNSFGYSYVIFGSSKVKNGGKINRNVLIFLLELYAHMDNPDIKVTNDFPCIVKKFKEDEVQVYKVLTNKNLSKIK